MCRLVAYTGNDILLADVLIKPEDSIIKQSLLAKESTVPTNGDGFGVGWYAHAISPNPAVFLSVFPAWNDENLLHLASKIKSALFFAHVRAASSGGVNNYNCHPFIYKNWMFMHNGHINDFQSIKHALINLLDEDIYSWIRGQTDSEHFFALFLQLAKGKNLKKLSVVTKVFTDTIKEINRLLRKFGKPLESFYNICLTDGERIIASRYCTDPGAIPESMHYFEGQYFWSKDRLSDTPIEPSHSVIIASEKLTDIDSQWHNVLPNHFLLVEKNYKVHMQAISI